MYTFTDDNAVVLRAQQILANRAYIPADAKPLMSSNIDESIDNLKEYLALDLGGLDVEHFKAYYFSPDGRLIKDVLISKGTEKETQAYPREVARHALLNNATVVVIAHNHPNGDTRPSEPDKRSAIRIYKALEAVDVQLAFAFVVAGPTPDKVEAIEPPDSLGEASSAIKGLLEALKSSRPQH